MHNCLPQEEGEQEIEAEAEGSHAAPIYQAKHCHALHLIMHEHLPQEKEENKKLKQKQRDRMQPKVGKLDIDYQVLHDAFFKHQTKPHLTRLGEIYYEGKEFEARVSPCLHICLLYLLT